MYSESNVKGEKLTNFGKFGLKTIPDYLKYYAEKLKENEAFVFASGERKFWDVVSWKMLYENSFSTAMSLVQIGVKERELVAVNLRTCPEWLYITFGAMMAGAIPVPIAFVYEDGSDIIEVMKRLEKCSTLVMDPGWDGENLKIIKRLVNSCNDSGEVECEQMPYLRNLIVHDPANIEPQFKCRRLDDLVNETDNEIKLPPIDEDEIAVLLQTSGSTGIAKLVAHTHKSLLLTCLFQDCGWFTPENVYFNDPHSRGLEDCPCLVSLVRNVLAGEDDPHWRSATNKKYSVKYWKCLQISMLRLRATEFILMSSMVVDDPEQFTEYACGRVVAGPGLEVKIVDDNEQIVPVNTGGEIYIRSPCMFKGYFNDKVRTDRVKSKDGWYRTGDLGKMNEDGFFYIDGRKSNIIISGGINVLPEVMEPVIKACPGIESVVVVPVPDDVSYQLLCVSIVPKPGSGLTAAQVQTFCEGLHNDRKGVFTVLPKFYLLFAKFPETRTGKTSRIELARIAAASVKG
ncbi:crotonobetaine/carnitine--CoA ligase-like [Mercenaria mercenaria]|uniref:crotonobetaine/carnitine--CoA ligase-like n=1 Tax=Mercenaria mercenaria TaxID=6596 RepID=UPI00234F37BC|nr:crotonobetaine/carnitine--CoA ligase-like [Mercenaria mercenaria]